MKKFLRRNLPYSLIKLLRKIKKSRFNNYDTKTVFTQIYAENFWSNKESISGPGSTFEVTKTLIYSINQLISNYNIKSVLDVPCGDFNWMKNIDFKEIQYIGGDIVDDLILSNIERYKHHPNTKFITIDIIKDDLPKSDLLIVRDCLVHFSNEDIQKAITNIKKSSCKYLLTTTFLNCKSNQDITTGEWRKINLQIAPFNLSSPDYIINEYQNESTLKSLALWEISKL
ncbi:MAG: hypothetical protein RIR48_3584 [Bacteroidota bacterium]|jgi:hypothetical protein